MTKTDTQEMTVRDISSEQWREYRFLEIDKVYRIELPVELHVRKGGAGHRVVDSSGVTHWVPISQPHVLRWKAKDECQKVAF